MSPVEQPWEQVVRRFTFGRVPWVELSCGHEMPVSTRPTATRLRCQDCNPVRRPAVSS